MADTSTISTTKKKGKINMKQEKDNICSPAFEIARMDAEMIRGPEYENWGFIAFLDGNRAAISKFGHCSCYGTWDDEGGGSTPLWEGTKAELKKLATKKLDPTIPFRPLDVQDYDYQHLSGLYENVLKYFQTQKKGKRVKQQ